MKYIEIFGRWRSEIEIPMGADSRKGQQAFLYSKL